MTRISVEQEVIASILNKYSSVVDDVDGELASFPGVTDGGAASAKIGVIAENAMQVGTLATVVEHALCDVTTEVVAALLSDDEDAADVFAGLDGYGAL